MTKTKKKNGRPPVPEKVLDQILKRIAGGETLKGICREKGMPAHTTICTLVINNEEFHNRYIRARQQQAVSMSEEILTIADTPHMMEVLNEENDEEGEDKKKGEYKKTQRRKIIREATEHRRLQIETRKFLLSKVWPRVFGTPEQGNGGDQKPPGETLPPVEPQTMEEAEAQYRRLLEL